MRYYNLTCTDPSTGRIWGPTSDGRLVKGPAPNAASSGGISTSSSGMTEVKISAKAPFTPKYTFCSHPNGLLQPPDPGALNIEFDIPVYPQHTFQGGSVLTLSGVGLRMLGQSANLNNQAFTLAAGMGKGLPLAKPAQAGEIIRGTIYQAFGNWVGTNQTLNLVLHNSLTDIAPSTKMLLNWQPGQTLANALTATFAQAFPSLTAPPPILSPQLQSPPRGVALQHTADGMTDFAMFIHELTQRYVRKVTGNQNYNGVWIVIKGNKILVSDGTQAPPKTSPIAFEDLIGQPTWINATSITFKTTLRADIQVSDFITLPTTVAAPYAISSAASAVPNAPSSSSSAFKGTFWVNEIHHWGNFREPSGEAWNSTFTASYVSPGALT